MAFDYWFSWASQLQAPKNCVFNDHCWELKNAKVYFFLNFDFEVICSLVYFMISSFDLKKDNLCTTYMTRNH